MARLTVAARRVLVADLALKTRIPLSAPQDNLRAILDEVYPLEQTEIATFYDETCLLRSPRIHIQP